MISLSFIFRADEFFVSCPGVGQLSHIRIGHNNSGVGDGWFLDKVSVEDLATGSVYDFPCGRWLAADEDDKKTYRDLQVDVGVVDAAPDTAAKTVKTNGVKSPESEEPRGELC